MSHVVTYENKTTLYILLLDATRIVRTLYDRRRQPKHEVEDNGEEVATSLTLLPHFLLDQHTATLVILLLFPISSLGCVD
jgi:hypothetical protein